VHRDVELAAAAVAHFGPQIDEKRMDVTRL